jgi:hypothetical protein
MEANLPDADKTREDLVALLVEKSLKDSQIEKLLGELHSECRAFRDTEFKVVAGFLTTLGFVFAACALLLSRVCDVGANLVTVVSSLALGFCTLLAVLVVRRIRHDHLIYEDLFRRIGAIREYWKIRDFFPARAAGTHKSIIPGSGTGWFQNVLLIVVSVVFVATFIGVGMHHAANRVCGPIG